MYKLEDLGLLTKLVAVAALALLATSATAWWVHRATRTDMNDGIAAVTRYEARIRDTVAWRGLVDAHLQQVIATAVTGDSTVTQMFAARIKDGAAAIAAKKREIEAGADSPAEKEALATVAQRRSDVDKALRKVDDYHSTYETLLAAQAVNKELMPAVEAYFDAINALARVQQGQLDEATAASNARATRNAAAGGLAIVLVAVASIAGVTWLTRSITRPLDHVIHATEAIARGDLTQRIETTRRDEVGRLMQAIGSMNDRLRELVAQVRGGVESVSTASREIASGNGDLSVRTERTAANLQQTSAAMVELTRIVLEASRHAEHVNELAGDSARDAQQGGEVVGQVVRSMRGISESSRRIADIIGVIDAIAFQTNILALNASVEAARAGEHGRGFAVVAGEVQSLAHRSAAAAKEIKSLIESSGARVEDGVALVERTGRDMTAIVDNICRMREMVGAIAQAGVAQRDGIQHANAALARVDEMTQQNAALVEESAASAASLREQAQRLAVAVKTFNVG
ncbi:MAG: methyl-accepting chemotaxis protein [Burkholderiaceae bacterium]